MEWITIVERYAPIIIPAIMAFFVGEYRKAKKLLNAFNKALADDKITPEELEEFKRIYKEG